MPSDVLQKIVANKRRELLLRKSLLSLEHLKKDLPNSKKSFFDALNTKKSDFIFECKKASPSKGLIRENYNLDEILDIYKDYASAISVLTDNRYFQGSFQHLQKVTKTVKQPVLCKDFFIDIYQVYEARYFGADAILLMLSVLSDEQYQVLADTAKTLDLDILTEVHDEDEMNRALNLEAKIIGINNRNLKDLSIDLSTTKFLLDNLSETNKQGRVFISESGINNHHQVRELAPLVSGFLIGSSIMAKPDIRRQCKKLIFGVNKICGLTDEQSAATAFEQGAIYGGLIFYPKSPRYVDINKASKIVNAAALDYVGVFVDESKQKLIDIANQLKLSVIQLHGSEDESYIKSIRQTLPQCEIWKAISVKSGSIDDTYLHNKDIDRLLFDTYNEELVGGSGKIFDWSLLDSTNKQNIILAGGIDITNIEQAIQQKTYALDINSGVETHPGVKSNKKISEIFKALHA